MKLRELLQETTAQINAIGNISTAMTQYIYGLIQAAQSEFTMSDDDFVVDKDTGEEVARTHMASIGTERKRRKLDLSPEGQEEWMSNMSGAIWEIVQGNTPKGRPHETGHIELGTVKEILDRMNFKMSDFSPKIIDHLSKTWILITDKSQYQGVAYGEELDKTVTDEYIDGNRRIELAAAYFIRPSRVNQRWITSILSHELTHIMDDFDTKGKYVQRRDGSNKGADPKTPSTQIQGDSYWKLQYEVNARFTQLAYDINRKFGDNPSIADPSKRQMVVTRLLTKYKLTPQYITQAQYQQVLKRLSKYMDEVILKSSTQ